MAATGRNPVSTALLRAARQLCASLETIRFLRPVSFTYNPLIYAWEGYEAYTTKFAKGPRRVVFLGMNPGPFGMVQTGVPFGEVNAVKNWLGIVANIGKPAAEHAKRPVLGYDCRRCEISGQRLWGLFAQRYPAPEAFFAEHFVVNYCPLAFLEASGRNLTPDKLPARQKARLFAACDEHLLRVVEALRPSWIIGIGAFAANRAHNVGFGNGVRVGKLLHPSPASPTANRDWAGRASAELIRLGIWE